jgi:hypothetical protein
VCSLEWIPHITAVLYVLAGAGGLTIVICIGLWLRYCRWVINNTMNRGAEPDPVELIRVTSLGMIGRSPKPPLLAGESSDSLPRKKAA